GTRIGLAHELAAAIESPRSTTDDETLDRDGDGQVDDVAALHRRQRREVVQALTEVATRAECAVAAVARERLGAIDASVAPLDRVRPATSAAALRLLCLMDRGGQPLASRVAAK